MPSIYVHLSGRDIECAIKRIYGLEEEEEDKTIKPIKCPRCGEVNTPQARFCHKCGLPLDEKERLQALMDETKAIPHLMTQILENPKLREKFKVMLQMVEVFENDPKAMEKLTEIIEELIPG